jgi:hypothetical protein
MSSQEFIGAIKGEAERCLRRPAPSSNSAFGPKGKKGNRKPKASNNQSLLKRITDEVTEKVKSMKISNSDTEVTEKPYCTHCKKKGHFTQKCWYLGKDKCIHCDKFNHISDDCYFKDKPKVDKKGKGRENPRKHSRNEEANTAKSDNSYIAIEEVENANVADSDNSLAAIAKDGEASSNNGETSSGGITFDSSESGQYFNFDNKDVANYSMNDESTLYYDWLADSVMTSHITNRRDTFVTYEPIKDTPITSVGGLQAQAKGCGDVKIEAIHQGVVYPIRLCNILYVPRNRNNLFSLGCWIAKGGDFSGRKLALVSKQGNIITTGTLTPNNLIQFRFRCTLNCDIPPDHAFISTTQLVKSWDVWHCRFGHIGHSGLQKNV